MTVSELHCPDIRSWMAVNLNTSDTIVETSVNATCPDKRVTLKGASFQTAVCSSSGEWQPSLLPCQQPAADIAPTESDQAAKIGIITLIVCGVVVAFIVIIDIPIIVIQLRQTFLTIKMFFWHF